MGVIHLNEEKIVNWQIWNAKTIGTTSKDWQQGFLKPLINFFPNLKSKTILDLGCGNGEVLTAIARQNPKLIIGIDTDTQALKNCKKKTRCLINVKVEFGNAQSLKYKNNSFDIIYSIGLIEHFCYPTIIMKEAKRMLKPNGTLIIAVPNGKCLWRELKLIIKPSEIWELKYSIKTLSNLLKNNGFKNREVKCLNYSPLKVKLNWWLLGKGTK